MKMFFNVLCTFNFLFVWGIIAQCQPSINHVDSLGIKQGVWETKYTNGKIESRSIYKNGKLNGAYFFFSQDGDVINYAYFIDGVRDGSAWGYENSGYLRVVDFANGQIIHAYLYKPDGILEMEEFYIEGHLDRVIHYTDNGNIEGQ